MEPARPKKGAESMKADQARYLVNHYEQHIRLMQGEVFFCQDEDGVLRRWYPPRLHPSRVSDAKEDS